METPSPDNFVSPAYVQTYKAADGSSPPPASMTHNPSVWPVIAERGTQVGADLSVLPFSLILSLLLVQIYDPVGQTKLSSDFG